MNPTFLLPFLATVISTAWLNGTKATCERRYDYVYFFNTIQFNGLFSLLFLCVVAGLIFPNLILLAVYMQIHRILDGV